MHGIKTNVLTTGTRAIAALSSGIIGLIATADDADAQTFPLDTPVLVSNLRAVLDEAGTTGTLRAALDAIYDQTSPILIVVRVAEAETQEDQDAAVIGDAGLYSGLYALLAAQAQTGYRPRILGAPGLDTQAVTTALATVARRLRAMVYARGIGASIADVATYRENFAARELMLIWPNWSNAFAGDAVARAMGLRAQIDQETGWHKSLSNVAVQGVTGISENLFFDIQDDTTDVALLNDAQITTLVRSPAGGFVYWGNRTCSDEPLFAFEPAVRTSQMIQDEIARGLVWAADRPLTRFLIKDVVDTGNARLRSLVAQGRLIGGRMWFDDALNPAETLANGQLVIDYDFTPAAPLEGLTLNQRITDRYYADLAADLSTDLAAA